MNKPKKQLYRDPKNGKIAGVCAGLAEYFNAEVWLIRVIFVSLFLFSAGLFATLAYIAACFILDELPEKREWQQSIYQKKHIKQRAWQAGQTPKSILAEIDNELAKTEKDIEQLEGYVTSFAFKMAREFKTH
jgi:phage shock protein C